MRRTAAEREHELLEAIVAGQQARGYAPTRRELAATIGISTTRVQQLVQSCTRKGLLSCPPRAARAYVVTEHATRTRKGAR
jgi:SOS-response transcriptional repressor LexA